MLGHRMAGVMVCFPLCGGWRVRFEPKVVLCQCSPKRGVCVTLPRTWTATPCDPLDYGGYRNCRLSLGI